MDIPLYYYCIEVFALFILNLCYFNFSADQLVMFLCARVCFLLEF